MICLVGLSPQVVTEAIYGLITQTSPAFIPTELHLIVNGAGESAVLDSFVNNTLSPFVQLQREYLGTEQIRFAPKKHIHVIKRDGMPVDDIQSIEDNAAMADLMLHVARELAADPECAIHASIAGGRKSMSYYLGHVMTLVGRPQDRMSHVLLNPPFERMRDFFYPPKIPKNIKSPTGDLISTSKANVVLVPIAFVRLSDGLHGQVVSLKTSYTDLIDQAQAAISKSTLKVYVSERLISYGNKSVQLTSRLFAWYLYFAERKRDKKMESNSFVTVGAIEVAKEFKNSIGMDQLRLTECCKLAGATDIKLDKYPISDFRSVLSDIKSDFRAAFGLSITKRIAILGPRDRRAKDGQYGLLGVDADDVEIFTPKVKITSI